MERTAFLGALVASVAVSGIVAAAELKSGPQVGDPLEAFNVTKIAGPEDGVKVGETLCYR